MRTTTILYGLLAAATTTLAAPGTAARRARHEARKAGDLRSHPFIPSNTSSSSQVNGPSTEQQVSYSENWSGAALVGSNYTGITGTFVVPTPQAPSGGSSSTTYSASAWVGLDGYTCTSAILQTGIDLTVQNGKPSFAAWYEWYPAYAYDFTGITISAGNTLKLTIVATSTTSGTATVENVSTGQSVTHTFTAQTGSLCGTNAEWIVEDYEQNSALVPLANFGTVTFSAAAVTEGGKTVGVSGAQVIDMSTSSGSSGVEAKASLSGSSGVVVSYV